METRSEQSFDKDRIDSNQKHPFTSGGMSAWIMPLAKRFRLIILLVFGLSLAAIWAIPRIVIQNDLMFMLPEDNAAKNQYLDAEELLGNAGGTAIAIQSIDGIYRVDLLERVRELAARCRALNLRIPARQLALRWGLSSEHALALAGVLQSLSSDPDFTPQLLAELLAAPAELAEAIGDSLPALLTVDDTDRFSRELADRMAALAASHAAFPGDLAAFAHQTTDRRGHFKNTWVDKVVALTETDTVWPEFTDYGGIAEAVAPFDIMDGEDLKRFVAQLLEAGAVGPDALLQYHASHPKPADISDAFWSSLAGALTPEAAQALSQALAQAPKQIRVGDLVPREITTDSMTRIRQRLHAWPFLQEGIYSQDEKSLLVVVRSTPNLDQPNRELLLEGVKEEVAQLFGDGRYAVHMAGYSIVDQAVAENMRQDIVRLLPLVFVVVTLFLFCTFRNPAGVLYPMVTILLAVGWCMGVMALLDVPLSVVGTAMPVLLVAVGSACLRPWASFSRYSFHWF